MEYVGGLLWGCLCDVCETLLGLFLEILQKPMLSITALCLAISAHPNVHISSVRIDSLDACQSDCDGFMGCH